MNGKKGLFDGEVARNGNNLKGLSKTDFFVARLQKGEHTINFIPDQKPFLKTITIYQIEDQKKISIIPTIQQAAAKIINFEDSIEWGIRWLYHKAQGITKDGTRYWRTWNYGSTGIILPTCSR